MVIDHRKLARSHGSLWFCKVDGGPVRRRDRQGGLSPQAAMAELDLEGLIGRGQGCIVPAQGMDFDPVLEQCVLFADHYPVLFGIQAGYIPGGLVREAQAPALANGVVKDAPVLPQDLALGVDDLARLFRQTQPLLQVIPGSALIEKTDVLALAAAKISKSGLFHQLVGLFLGHLAQGEHDALQLVLVQAGQEIGLVLVLVLTPAELNLPLLFTDLGVMAGGHGRHALGEDVLKESAKLDGLIADNAGIGSQATAIAVREGAQDLGRKGLMQVDAVERDVQPGGDLLNPLSVGGKIRLSQFHEKTRDPVLLFEEQGRGRGINSTAHGNSYTGLLHCITCISRRLAVPLRSLGFRLLVQFHSVLEMYLTMDKKERSMIRIPELLAPAGTFAKLQTAIHYGADAVYLGGSGFSLRAKAGNFDRAGMEEAVVYAHEHGARVYVTVNIFAHNRDLVGLDEYLLELQTIGVDGLIIADPGILSRARRLVPGLPIHLSTQANVTNAAAATFWQEQGAVRLNLARELSLEEIVEVRGAVTAELEIFVHGALCISYSGRCMLSNYMTGRDANQGHCAHPCRYSYALMEEKRPDQYFPVEEDEHGTYIFNSKDLCLLERLPELVAAGVDSLKLEGRMKSLFYVGGVVRVYRAALDYLAGLAPAAWENPAGIRLPDRFMAEVAAIGTRGGSENFFDSQPGAADMLYQSSRAPIRVEPVAVVLAVDGCLLVEARNPLEVGDEIEYLGRSIEPQSVRVCGMLNEQGQEQCRANPGNRVCLQTEPAINGAVVHGMLRRMVVKN